MGYLFLKFIHVISSTILFGTGIGTASVMVFGYFQSSMQAKLAIYRYVALVDWFFTGVSGVVQPVTGLVMVYLMGFSLTMPWLFLSIMGYVIAGICWIAAVFFQLKIRDLTAEAIRTDSDLPPLYYKYFKYWFMVGWPAFFSLIGVFYLMVAKPIF